MSRVNKSFLSVEQLDDRIVPTVAYLNHGQLTVVGDNLGNNISVGANANGNIQVTERGQAVPIYGGPATVTTVTSVKEVAGTGHNNTLSTAASLGSIPDTLVGNGSGTNSFLPLNNAPSTATGSSNAHAVNYFSSNPGGQDTFVGGNGANLFYWGPGTGTDTYIGHGTSNTVLVIGNNTPTAETDTLMADGSGGATYSRVSPGPFQIFTKDIQTWIIQPTVAAGSNQLIGNNSSVTIGNLSGTPTQLVETDLNNGIVNATAQKNPNVVLRVGGQANNVSGGAGPTLVDTNRPIPSIGSIVSGYQSLEGDDKAPVVGGNL